MTARDIKTGDVFGKWIAVSRAPNGKRNEIYWVCRCTCTDQCQVIKPVCGTSLVHSRSLSCGAASRGRRHEGKALKQRREAVQDCLAALAAIAEIVSSFALAERAGRGKRAVGGM